MLNMHRFKKKEIKGLSNGLPPNVTGLGASQGLQCRREVTANWLHLLGRKKRNNTAGSNRETVKFEKITPADIPNKLKAMSWRRRVKKGSLTCANTVHFSPHRWRILSHKHENTLSTNAPTDWLSCCEKKNRVIVIYNSKSGKRTLCADV